MNNNLPIFHGDDDETMMTIIVMMMKCSSILCQQIKLNVTRDPGPGYPEMQGFLLSQIRIVSA